MGHELFQEGWKRDGALERCQHRIAVVTSDGCDLTVMVLQRLKVGAVTSQKTSQDAKPQVQLRAARQRTSLCLACSDVAFLLHFWSAFLRVGLGNGVRLLCFCITYHLPFTQSLCLPTRALNLTPLEHSESISGKGPSPASWPAPPNRAVTEANPASLAPLRQRAPS